MTQYDPKIHHRRSIRLMGYDYSQPGLYFITLCTHNRAYLFGEIKEGKMILNKYGVIAEKAWLKTESIRDNLKIDAFVIMPNHVHGIIQIVRTNSNSPQRNTPHQETPQPKTLFKSPSKTIGAIIRGYKATVTKQIHNSSGQYGTPVWQRNYYEHIIRNDNDYQHIYDYIIDNPAKWQDDKFNS